MNAPLPDDERLASLSLSDILNMTLLGDESFYRCEPADAAIERLETENVRLQKLGDELAYLLEEARNERDMYKQQRADWKAAHDQLVERHVGHVMRSTFGE